jgi:hypothetical protein
MDGTGHVQRVTFIKAMGRALSMSVMSWLNLGLVRAGLASEDCKYDTHRLSVMPLSVLVKK